jgi:DNA-binding CsgD family transcriptional regulator/PAS domain-containing protein
LQLATFRNRIFFGRIPGMTASDSSMQLEVMIDAIYEAALEPGAWGDVMRHMRTLFDTTAETFYVLDPLNSRVHEVHLAGVASRWVECFNEAYFSGDNPWMQLSENLHRPGIVRTNERLAHITRDAEVLYRSQYYNDWMRPQDFRYSLGNTLLREPGLIANVTLFRPGGMRTYSAQDVKIFERLSRHMTRALRVGVQMGRQGGEQVLHILERMNQAALVLDPRGAILFANSAAERLLRERDGLASRHGSLAAACAQEQPALAAWLASATALHEVKGTEHSPTLILQRAPTKASRPPLTLSILPLASGKAGYHFGQRTLLLLVSERTMLQPARHELLRAHFGFTAAEARLARTLASGHTLRAAAARSNISYGTARSYLKILFQKTATHRQSELVRCLLGVADFSDATRR